MEIYICTLCLTQIEGEEGIVPEECPKCGNLDIIPLDEWEQDE